MKARIGRIEAVEQARRRGPRLDLRTCELPAATVRVRLAPLLHRAQFAVAVYGIISIAVVVVAWDADGDPWELAALAIGYALAIWLAHSFANVVSGGPEATWRAALVHEEPVMIGAVPVVRGGDRRRALGLSPEAVELAGADRPGGAPGRRADRAADVRRRRTSAASAAPWCSTWSPLVVFLRASALLVRLHTARPGAGRADQTSSTAVTARPSRWAEP